MSDVLLLCEYPTLNGGERSLLSTLDGVRAAGYAPAVLCPPQGPLAAALHERSVEVIPFACRASDGTRHSQSRLRETLAEVLRARRPRLLHANSLSMGRLSGPVAAELATPSIAHLRDIVKLSSQAVRDLNCHGRLLAVSQAVREFHAGQGLDASKIHVLYNGVDLDRFRPRPPTHYLHRELGLPADALLIGTIGQLGLRKGQDVLLQAAQTVAAQLPNVHYLLVGERNSDKEESRRFEQQLHVTATGALIGKVHFLGVRNDVDRLLNELTLLVHPALQEPLGRVLLEAAASGVAVIAADVGGTAEIFPPDCHAAWLTPPGDAHALAAAIETLCRQPEDRHAMASAARQRAEAQFDVQTAVVGLLGHYQAM